MKNNMIYMNVGPLLDGMNTSRATVRKSDGASVLTTLF